MRGSHGQDTNGGSTQHDFMDQRAPGMAFRAYKVLFEIFLAGSHGTPCRLVMGKAFRLEHRKSIEDPPSACNRGL